MFFFKCLSRHADIGHRTVYEITLALGVKSPDFSSARQKSLPKVLSRVGILSHGMSLVFSAGNQTLIKQLLGRHNILNVQVAAYHRPTTERPRREEAPEYR